MAIGPAPGGVAEGASEDGEDAADRPTGEPGLLELEDEDGDPVRADLANPTMTEARVDVTIESRAVELPRAWAQVVLCCKPLIPHLLKSAVGADHELSTTEACLHLGLREPRFSEPPGTRCQRTRPLESRSISTPTQGSLSQLA